MYRMRELTPMYRIENILARNNSRKLRGTPLRIFNRRFNDAYKRLLGTKRF